MPRSRATNGPLTLSVTTGPRAALFIVHVAGDGSEQVFRNFRGYFMRREILKNGGCVQSIWMGDPRTVSSPIKPPPSTMSPRPEEIKHEEGAITPNLDCESELEISTENAKGKPRKKRGWNWAIRHLIRDFKWGDYTTEAGTMYRYTLYAICGDSSIGCVSSKDECCHASGDEDLPTSGPGLHVWERVSLEVVTPPVYGGPHEVHFNRGVTGQRYAHLFGEDRGKSETGLPARSPEEWTWLSRGLEEALLHFLSLAEGPGWKIRAALYECHYLPVMQALANARQRGVDVAVIADWKIASWSDKKKTWTQRGPQHMNLWACQEAGLLNTCLIQRTKPLSAISHNKFFVIVRPSGHADAVWTGSTNITAGALFGHSNVGHVVRDRCVAAQYLSYWEKLQGDPDKSTFAKFNEELTPLPMHGNDDDSSDDDGAGCIAGLKVQDSRVLFAPRLRWARALDFFAQLIMGAEQCVCFTAAFGVGKELGAALLTRDQIPVYLLLEGEGNWASAREIARSLRKKTNVATAIGTHIKDEEGWLQESPTGLNTHVKYVHTKILLVDPFSSCPIVVSGSANFSKASMETNDENILVTRGNQDLADAYVVEFFRNFEHMRFRNEVEKREPNMCRCGQAPAERVVSKEGPNFGRPFLTCSKDSGKACNYFAWADNSNNDDLDIPAHWPQNCFDGSKFQFCERRMFEVLGADSETKVAKVTEEPEDNLNSDVQDLTEMLGSLGLADSIPAASGVSEGKCVKVQEAIQAAQELMTVDLRKKGGKALYDERRQVLYDNLEKLPTGECKENVLGIISMMDSAVSPQKKSSWGPFVVDILRTLGEDPEKIKPVIKRGRPQKNRSPS